MLALVLGQQPISAQEVVAERNPGSWVIIQSDPTYDMQEDCFSEAALASGEAEGSEAGTGEACPVEAGPPGLKFRLDLLPTIREANALQIRQREIEEARRKARAARGAKPPLLGANGDLPLTYSFNLEQKGQDDRYLRDQVNARANVGVDGYQVQATLEETSQPMQSGTTRKSGLRVEAPLTFGPVRMRTGLDTYVARDTTAGVAATSIGRGIDVTTSARLSEATEAELSGKVEYVRDGGKRVNAIIAGTVNYGFMLGEWKGKLSPGLDITHSTGEEDPVTMAVRMRLSLASGPQKVEVTQRMVRQQILSAEGETQQTSLDYGYNWDQSSITLSGAHLARSANSGATDDWQVGAVWKVKLEALTDYLQ